MLTPTNSFLLLGVVTSVPLLAKIDQAMRPWETDTGGHRQWQTQSTPCLKKRPTFDLL